MMLLSVSLFFFFFFFFFFFNDTATTEIYTLSLHDALPIRLEPLLRSHAGSLAPDRVLFSHELAGFEQDSGGVTATDGTCLRRGGRRGPPRTLRRSRPRQPGGG